MSLCVYSPDYWKSLNTEEKVNKAKGYFDRMIECKDPKSIPSEAVFVVRLAIMNVKSGWSDVHDNHKKDYISYRDYLKMKDVKFAEFLDKPLGINSTYIDKKTIGSNYQSGTNFYYFTKKDLKDALEKCSAELNGRKEELHIDYVLDCIEENLALAGYKLAKDWRSVTEKNIAKRSLTD